MYKNTANVSIEMQYYKKLTSGLHHHFIIICSLFLAAGSSKVWFPTVWATPTGSERDSCVTSALLLPILAGSTCQAAVAAADAEAGGEGPSVYTR